MIDIVFNLHDYNVNILIFDPCAKHAIATHEYGVERQNELHARNLYCIALKVAHNQFQTLNISFLINGKIVVYDVKGFISDDLSDARL